MLFSLLSAYIIKQIKFVICLFFGIYNFANWLYNEKLNWYSGGKLCRRI